MPQRVEALRHLPRTGLAMPPRSRAKRTQYGREHDLHRRAPPQESNRALGHGRDCFAEVWSGPWNVGLTRSTPTETLACQLSLGPVRKGAICDVGTGHDVAFAPNGLH